MELVEDFDQKRHSPKNIHTSPQFRRFINSSRIRETRTDSGSDVISTFAVHLLRLLLFLSCFDFVKEEENRAACPSGQDQMEQE
ncbi:MAG TPA: hypothetical protein VD837_10320 [Terriglobales bacterium]|nr:hypothetical protein [Terriglobales bacterium]